MHNQKLFTFVTSVRAQFAKWCQAHKQQKFRQSDGPEADHGPDQGRLRPKSETEWRQARRRTPSLAKTIGGGGGVII